MQPISRLSDPMAKVKSLSMSSSFSEVQRIPFDNEKVLRNITFVIS